MRDGENRRKKRIFRFSALVILIAALAAGCGVPSKYEAIDLKTLGQNTVGAGNDAEKEGVSGEGDFAGGGEAVAQDETMASFSINADGAKDGGDAAGDGATAAAAGQEPAVYEEVDEVVVVTADVANIRESESQTAKIYAQLKRGSSLRRSGVSSDWSRVSYEGKTAYVASSLVQAQESGGPSGEDSAGNSAGAADGAEGMADGGSAGGPGPGGASDDAGQTGADVAAASGNGAWQAADGLASAVLGRTIEAAQAPFDGHIVAIDASHQAKANAEKEPIGPGADTMKAKMPEGALGTATGVEEYELTLQVARRLKKQLEDGGYRVVMVRDSNDVNLSSAERSQIASRGEADILIRLHANSLENSGVYGALAMCMTDQNPYNADLHAKSYSLSKKIVDSICGQTGTKNRGVQEVDSMSDINWSEMPVAVVEMGFLSNPDEDRWLSQETYQDKIAGGIRAAVDSYFSEGN